MVKNDGLLNVALMLPQEPQDKTEYGVQPVTIEELREVFKPWDVKFGALLDMAQQSAEWTLLHADGLEKWAHEKGRFALIGDSAHAMMPCL
jgi:salicylate hydroxylase